MTEREELYEAVEIVMVLSKHKYTKMTFAQESKLLSRIFSLSEKGEMSQEEQDKRFKKCLERFSCVLERLPQEILDTIENMEEFCLGYISKETKKLLTEYYQQEEEFFHAKL